MGLLYWGIAKLKLSYIKEDNELFRANQLIFYM